MPALGRTVAVTDQVQQLEPPRKKLAVLHSSLCNALGHQLQDWGGTASPLPFMICGRCVADRLSQFPPWVDFTWRHPASFGNKTDIRESCPGSVSVVTAVTQPLCFRGVSQTHTHTFRTPLHGPYALSHYHL